MRPLSLLLLIALVTVAAAALPAAPAAPAPHQLSALILSGENNHDWRTTTPVLERMYKAAGYAVDITEQPRTLTLADMRRYSVLVSNYNNDKSPRWGEPAESALLQYVREGGGLVIIHAANNAFGDWPEFDRLIGGAWRGTAGHGQYHRYVVKPNAARHPITKGMPAFLHAPDELYHRLTMQPTAFVIATAYSDPAKGGTGNDEPALWVVNYGEGRMFQTILGHGDESMSGEGFIVSTLRGTEWAATGKVTTPVPTARLLATMLASEDGEQAYAGKASLIAMGAAAVPALLDTLKEGGRATDNAYSALRWIAMRAAGTPQAAMVAKALLPGAAAGPAEQRAMAIRALGLVGPEQARTLLGYLKDKEVAEAALEAVAVMPGGTVTAALVGAMAGRSEDDVVRILGMLGNRGDASAVSAIARAAEPVGLRVAALQALGAIGSPQAVPTITKYLGDPTGHAAAFDALLQVAQAELAAKRPAAVRELCRQAIEAARNGRERVAALAGLGQVADSSIVPALSPLVSDADPDVAVAAINALAAVRERPGRGVLAAVRQAAADPRQPVALAALAALGAHPEEQMIEPVVTAAGSADPVIRTAALRALGNLTFSDMEPEPAVMQAITSAFAAEEPVRAAAVDAALAMLGRHSPDIRKQLGAEYAGVLAAATDDRQRLQALTGLAEGATAAQLPAIELALQSDNAEVRSVAQTALLTVAKSLQSADQPRAIALYERLLTSLPADERLDQVAAALSDLGRPVDLAASRGFITHWWVVGPWPNPENSGYEKAFAPEQGVDLAATYTVGDRKLSWEKYQSADGIVPLGALIRPAEDAAAYCYAEVTSPREQAVLLLLGSDDGAVLWLNGERLFGTPEPRGLVIDQDAVKGTLKPGVNRLLLKVLNGAADYQAALRITTPEGTALQLEQRQ